MFSSRFPEPEPHPNPNPNPNPNIKLIALDIDGTLLNERKEITQANLEALRVFRDLGGKVVLISGRLPRSAFWHARLLGLDTPFAALNGAVIGHGEQIVSGVTISQESVLSFLDYCRHMGLYCHIYTSEGMIFDSPARWNEHWSEQNLARLEGQLPPDQWRLGVKEYCPARQVDDLAEWVKTSGEPICKMAVLSEDALAEVGKELSEFPGIGVTSSDPRNLEICPAGVSKGTALQQIAGMLGISLQHIMAIGDNYNDLSLFEVAGFGVAMGNAPEPVKRAAQVVTRSNCDSGVAWAVHHLALGEGF